MRYKVENEKAVPITYIFTERNNPTDEVLDALGIGKPLEKNPEPAYNAELQYLEETAEEFDDKIVVSYSIKNKVIED